MCSECVSSHLIQRTTPALFGTPHSVRLVPHLDVIGDAAAEVGPTLSMFVIPAAYLLMRRPREAGAGRWLPWRRRRGEA